MVGEKIQNRFSDGVKSTTQIIKDLESSGPVKTILNVSERFAKNNRKLLK